MCFSLIGVIHSWSLYLYFKISTVFRYPDLCVLFNSVLHVQLLFDICTVDLFFCGNY